MTNPQTDQPSRKFQGKNLAQKWQRRAYNSASSTNIRSIMQGRKSKSEKQNGISFHPKCMAVFQDRVSFVKQGLREKRGARSIPPLTATCSPGGRQAVTSTLGQIMLPCDNEQMPFEDANLHVILKGLLQTFSFSNRCKSKGNIIVNSVFHSYQLPLGQSWFIYIPTHFCYTMGLF